MPLTFLDRLERRFGRFAIPNVTLAIIIGQAALFVANWLPGGIAIERLALIPAKVMEGEVWRLITFLFTPPNQRSILVIFYFALLHLFGSTLEQHWGVFRFNVFLLVGYLANVAAAFISAFVVSGQAGQPLLDASLDVPYATNVFLYSSLFLAFARLYPDFIINLFFVLPIRIRWLALLMWIRYGYGIISGEWTERLLILATVLNYLLFFGPQHWREFRQGQRRRSFQVKAKRALAPARHTCVVCGLSSDESPRTLFRYCSKCAGQRCYCPQHIANHEHISSEDPAAT